MELSLVDASNDVNDADCDEVSAAVLLLFSSLWATLFIMELLHGITYCKEYLLHVRRVKLTAKRPYKLKTMVKITRYLTALIRSMTLKLTISRVYFI